MCSIWGGFLSLASILDFQHCTDEAQKAETVLSAVKIAFINNFNNFKGVSKPKTFKAETLRHQKL